MDCLLIKILNNNSLTFSIERKYIYKKIEYK